MRNVRRHDLQDQPLAEIGRGGLCLAGIGRQHLVEHRNPGAGQDALRLVLGDAALRQRRQVPRHRRDRQWGRGQPLGAAHRRRDRADGAPRVLEQPDSGVLVAALHLRAGNRRQCEEAVRVARRRPGDGFEQRLGHLRRARPGGKKPDHRREIFLAEQQFEALVEDRRVVQRLRRHIDRVARRRERDPGEHLFLRILGERAQLQPFFLGGIGHQHAGAAGHRHYREPARARQASAGAGIGDLNQVFRRLRPLDPELP